MAHLLFIMLLVLGLVESQVKQPYLVVRLLRASNLLVWLLFRPYLLPIVVFFCLALLLGSSALLVLFLM